MNNYLLDPYLESMNFLNEISVKHPDAISFGSGRPKETYFEVERIVQGVGDFVRSHNTQHTTYEQCFNRLGQYNFTKGIINEAIATLLKNDEGIVADPEEIIVTDGAQEGMAIIINTLFSSTDDVLLVSDPSYVGFVGYAKICGIDVCTIARNQNSIDMHDLEQQVEDLIKKGKKPKALYEVPNFHNPTGSYMALHERLALLQLADKYNFFIVEDDPYGYFNYGVEKIPTLKALDTSGRVIYIGSFSKSIFPSLRVGFLVADGVFIRDNNICKLAEELKKVKSFLTVNTSTLLQSMAGALLEAENYSLKQFCKPKVEDCRKNRDAIVESIQRHFGPESVEKPPGGFFLAMELPFDITNERVLHCVEKYSVIFCPMAMFCVDKQHTRKNQIRLSFSNLSPEIIEEGIERLAHFVKDQMI